MMSHRKCHLIFFAFIFLTIPFLLARAQGDVIEAQYEALIKFEDRYVLWNVVTDTLTELPDLEVLQYRRPIWSPDGNYLLIYPYGEDNCCTGVYDVVRQTWDEHQFENYAVWSPSGEFILHTIEHESEIELVLYNWATGDSEVIYSIEVDVFGAGISDLSWSPDSQSIFFIEYSGGMGGTFNAGNVLYLPTRAVFSLNDGNDTWYARYDPNWSPNGRYLLFWMQTTAPIVRASSIVHDAEVGDVYLMDTYTGERHRVTNTPLESEFGIRWSEDGRQIIFTLNQDVTVSLEDALLLDDPLTDRSVIPELSALEEDGYSASIPSPDGRWEVWTSFNGCELRIINQLGEMVSYLSNYEMCENFFVSWRPLAIAESDG
jgi:Tol biopolymer transport system component